MATAFVHNDAGRARSGTVRVTNWLLLFVLLFLGLVWCVSCCLVIAYDDGDGACIRLGHGTFDYRGGASSIGSVAYTLVPMQQLKSNPPQALRVDVDLMRRLHAFPANGWRICWSFQPALGHASWPNREHCGKHFRCHCNGSSETSGFWCKTFSMPMWGPFIAVACVALVVWRHSIECFLWPNASPHACGSCDYDLSGNQSGICPECGTPIPPEQMERIK